MADVQIPRGAGPGLGPNELPSVSWFEFVLNDKLLEEHLAKENAEPSAVQLIVQFMQQAEIEMASLIQNTREQTAATASVSQPLTDIKVENVTQHKCRVCEQPKSSRDSHPSCFKCTGCLSENTCRYCKRWPRVQWKRLMVQYKSKSTPVLKEVVQYKSKSTPVLTEVVQYKSKSTPVLKELDMGLNLLSIPPLKRKETEALKVLRMEGSRSDDGAMDLTDWSLSQETNLGST